MAGSRPAGFVAAELSAARSSTGNLDKSLGIPGSRGGGMGGGGANEPARPAANGLLIRLLMNMLKSNGGCCWDCFCEDRLLLTEDAGEMLWSRWLGGDGERPIDAWFRVRA